MYANHIMYAACQSWHTQTQMEDGLFLNYVPYTFISLTL